MNNEITTHVRLDRDMQFTGSATSGHSVTLDAPVPEGKGNGLTPMELVLIGLGGCSGMDVLAILRKRGQEIHTLDVRTRGQRCNGNPSVFTHISLEFVISGVDIDHEAVARAIETTHQRYCPVWTMLEEKVEITSHYRILSDEPVTTPCD
ncbi:MAG: OsmC family protein [Roseiflexaceae bacterium]